MATSLTSPALVFASNTAIIQAHAYIAKISQFSVNLTPEAANPGTTLKVPVFKAGAAANFDATTNNYAKADGAVIWVPVTFDQRPKKTFSFTPEDFLLTNGTNFWRNSGTACGIAIGISLASTVSGLINKTNVPKSSTNELVLASVTKATIAKLRKACYAAGIDPARTVLMLKADAYSDLIALLDSYVYGSPEAIQMGIIPHLFGFKAVVENEYLSATDAENLVGALVPEDSLVIAGRKLPVLSQNYDEIGTTTDDESGLPLDVRRYTDLTTGQSYYTMEALFGASLVQADKIVRLVSAATA